MRNKKESLVLGSILQKIAPQIGATILIEPIWNVVGQITFKSGRHSYFRYNTLDLNPMGSAEIAHDKDYANFFMKSMGYPVVPDSKTFFSHEWGNAIGSPHQNSDAGYEYACTIGFPVIVKPNSGSQGVGVSLVHNKEEFYKAVRAIFKRDNIVLVQKYMCGTDYRIVVLDKKVISAYRRIPLNVTGDGKSTIEQLLKNKQAQFIASNRDTRVRTNDTRIVAKLSHQRLTLQSVLTTGQKIYLLDNANLSTGGDSVDVTKEIHPAFKKLAVKLTHDMGLRLCGVDLIIKGDISQKNDAFWILEINAAPGLDHYAKTGEAQEKIVENMYLTILKHLER